jgi:hypothetical protein
LTYVLIAFDPCVGRWKAWQSLGVNVLVLLVGSNEMNCLACKGKLAKPDLMYDYVKSQKKKKRTAAFRARPV